MSFRREGGKEEANLAGMISERGQAANGRLRGCEKGRGVGSGPG